MILRRSRTLQAACALTLCAGIAALLGCTEKLVEPPPPATVYAVPDSIQEIFTNNCLTSNCHGAPAPHEDMDLSDATTSYAHIVGVASAEKPTFFRIAPGDSADSYLVMKLRGDPRIDFARMPLMRPPLDPALILKIASWVDQGAPGVAVTSARTHDWAAQQR
jgi:hypothetical protein